MPQQYCYTTHSSKPTNFIKLHSVSPTGLERRISYPDARRRSVDNCSRAAIANRSRDPSLERRQQYYKQAPLPPAPAARYNNRYERAEYPPPRENGRDYDNRGRAGHGNRNWCGEGDIYRDHPQQYRRGAGLDLKKGGKRF